MLQEGRGALCGMRFVSGTFLLCSVHGDEGRRGLKGPTVVAVCTLWCKLSHNFANTRRATPGSLDASPWSRLPPGVTCALRVMCCRPGITLT